MIADQGEIGEMKKQWGSELGALKELFPDWTDVDLLLALQETNGDLERTVVHITEGAYIILACSCEIGSQSC